MNASIMSVNAGRPRIVVHGGRQYSTAINKQPTTEPAKVTTTGIDIDGQANRDVHGGEDMALCVYPHEHYEEISSRLGTELDVPAFGENLTTLGLLESQCRIGDTFAIGGAEGIVVQITQPRMPCSTLARKHDSRELGGWILETGYCGFYLRVIETGSVENGDLISLTGRNESSLTVESAMRAMHDRRTDRRTIEQLIACEGLSDDWRQQFQKRLHD